MMGYQPVTCPHDRAICSHMCPISERRGPLPDDYICYRQENGMTMTQGLETNLGNLDLSPDAPVETNYLGGKQSHITARLDLLDGPTMLRLGQILGAGAEKYTPNNWRLIPVEDHVNHALVHLMGYLAGDTQDDHLGHALCRLMFACATEKS